MSKLGKPLGVRSGWKALFSLGSGLNHWYCSVVTPSGGIPHGGVRPVPWYMLDSLCVVRVRHGNQGIEGNCLDQGTA